MTLNENQRRFLTWIRDNPHSRSAWLDEKGKSPRGKNAKFAIMEISGQFGSVRIAEEDQQAIMGLIEPADWKETGRIYKLTNEGIESLGSAP